MAPIHRADPDLVRAGARAAGAVLAGFAGFLLGLAAPGTAGAALTVPTDVQQPGSQPGEVSQLEDVGRCDNCHGHYNPNWEPWFKWSGSLMAHAGRDPIFWATMAIAEQDFDGAGDLCLRCHATEGWVAGRSTPTDGSGLGSGDTEGVQCDLCHRLTNPDDSEHLGEQNAPFLANDESTPATGYYGSGMYVLWDGSAKLGPYSDATARHQELQSQYHRSSELCGTCHDVSNPVVGDLAPNNGAQTPLAEGTFSGVPGTPVDGKAAFNNFPYQYGIVERTFSEHVASAFPTTLVDDYATALPPDLQVVGGTTWKAWQDATQQGTKADANYEDGALRYFTCQSCHMPPVQEPLGAEGCNKNPPDRLDLPEHDMTGGNYWIPEAIQWLDDPANPGELRLGGGLTQEQKDALNEGILRARGNLERAASLSVTDNVVKVVNLTGHKLISGYPEGRRMWLEIEWYEQEGGTKLATDGEYGSILVDLDDDGTPEQPVDTLRNLHDPYTRIYEVHPAMTQEWAAKLVSPPVSKPGNLPLSYDRIYGMVTKTLGELAAQPENTYHETFHFVLNNYVAKDNRIPPWGVSYEEAVERNILPVPGDQFGNPGPGEEYDYWDEVVLNPPPGATHAEIELYYQPTSWEYIQFLYLANTGASAFLAQEGQYMLDAWLNTGMAAPHMMTSTTWTLAAKACADGRDNDGDGFVDTLDPGCSGPDDESENSAALVCDNRLDDDGDGQPDYPHDPGCQSPTATRENPQCQDGLNNDPGQDALIDFDGGASAGLPPDQVTDPDPQCVGNPSKNREKAGGCGLGLELAFLVPALSWLHQRRRGRRSR